MHSNIRSVSVLQQFGELKGQMSCQPSEEWGYWHMIHLPCGAPLIPLGIIFTYRTSWQTGETDDTLLILTYGKVMSKQG